MSLLALVIASTAGCNENRAVPNVDASAAVAASVTPNLLAESLWRDNQTYVYDVEVSSRAGVAGALPLAQYEMNGNLVVASRKVSGDAVQLAIHVANAHFQTAQTDAQSKYDALAQELLEPYVITLSQGAITEERLAKGSSSFAESIYRYLGGIFQLRAATSHEGLEARERDVAGIYYARYNANAAGTEVVRTKLRYDPITIAGKGPGVGGSKLAANVKDSKATIQLGDASVKSIELAESMESSVANGSAVSSTTKLKLTLKATSPTVSVVPWDTLMREGVLTQPGHMMAKSVNPAQFDELRIGNYTFEKALTELSDSAKRLSKKLAKDKASQGRPRPEDPELQKKELDVDERVFTAMAALLRRDTVNVDRAGQIISKNGVVASHLLDALASAGTPAAQQALVSIIENPKLDKKLRQRSAIALTRVGYATPGTIGAFTKLLHVPGFETAACYGLGTLSRHLRDNGDFGTADSIVDTLLKELKESKGEDWTVVVLRGIANSGNGKAFDAVEPFLKEPNARVREAAVESIRLMQESKVDTVLQSILATETDESVRAAAIDACAMRPMTPRLLQSVSSAGLTGKSTRVRQRAVQVLAMWAPQNPEALSALKSVSAFEQNPNVRREAETAESRVAK